MLSYYVSLHSECRVVGSVAVRWGPLMFSLSLPRVVCVRAHVLFSLFVFVGAW